ncbi:NUDIX domain-containing protein [Actinocorallia populi]|uniref:NUDIX domain-containing protein n=1 Tax=Actinocorallia populi TaxID=2079200 RepID=UPI001E3FA2B6|nr:NUDIX domain-containing protein [Actinocorallia populi]
MFDPYGFRREKLVRDLIPQLMRQAGKEPDIRVAERSARCGLLLAKLYEEADEFAADPSPGELADLLEVVLALAGEIGCGAAELERVRAAKAAERGGFAEGYVLRGVVPPDRPVVRKARVLLLDGADLVLFRRTRPGVPTYWTTPGGRVEPDDPDTRAAARRELMEELGATAGPLHGVFTYTEHRPKADYVHRFFLGRLESMDLSLRCGPEFDDPERGGYEVDRFPCRGESFTGLPLWPARLREFLAEEAGSLPRILG